MTTRRSFLRVAGGGVAGAVVGAVGTVAFSLGKSEDEISSNPSAVINPAQARQDFVNDQPKRALIGAAVGLVIGAVASMAEPHTLDKPNDPSL